MVISALSTAMLSAFGVGLVATLSPCVYPILPITLGYFGTQINHGMRAPVVLFSLGQWLALIVLGGLMIFLGETLGFSADIWWVKVLVGGLLIAFAFMSYMQRMPSFITDLNRFSQKSGASRKRSTSWLGALLLGASSAAILSPCTTPLLGSVLTTAMTQPSPYLGIMIMAAYGLGFSSIFLLLGLGVLNIKKMPRSGAWLNKVHHLASALILGFGVYQLYVGLGARFWGIY